MALFKALVKAMFKALLKAVFKAMFKAMFNSLLKALFKGVRGVRVILGFRVPITSVNGEGQGE